MCKRVCSHVPDIGCTQALCAYNQCSVECRGAVLWLWLLASAVVVWQEWLLGCSCCVWDVLWTLHVAVLLSRTDSCVTAQYSGWCACSDSSGCAFVVSWIPHVEGSLYSMTYVLSNTGCCIHVVCVSFRGLLLIDRPYIIHPSAPWQSTCKILRPLLLHTGGRGRGFCHKFCCVLHRTWSSTSQHDQTAVPVPKMQQDGVPAAIKPIAQCHCESPCIKQGPQQRPTQHG